MADGVGGGTVLFGEGVDCRGETSAGTLGKMSSDSAVLLRQSGDVERFSGSLTVWASAGAAVGVVAELVDVHPTLGGRVVPLYVVGDGCGGLFGSLLKGDGALDIGVTTENGNYTDRRGSVSLSNNMEMSSGGGVETRIRSGPHGMRNMDVTTFSMEDCRGSCMPSRCPNLLKLAQRGTCACICHARRSNVETSDIPALTILEVFSLACFLNAENLGPEQYRVGME